MNGTMPSYAHIFFMCAHAPYQNTFTAFTQPMNILMQS